MRAKYTHDCEACRLVGFATVHGKRHDFYVCESGSVVARFGHDGPDYWSLNEEFVRHPKALDCSRSGTKDYQTLLMARAMLGIV